MPFLQGMRAQVVLLAVEGTDNTSIGEVLGVSRQRFGRMRGRFSVGGVKILTIDAPRPGGTPPTTTDWRRALMARVAGVGSKSVGRICQHGLKPHQTAHLKASRAPGFTKRLEAIVGLHLSPPQLGVGSVR